MTAPDPILEVRRRLLEDFSYYAEKCLKIRTKSGEIKPLILNRAQLALTNMVSRQMAETGRVRVIIPKARQLGLSTVVGAWLYWWTSQRHAQKAVVITHKSESTRALFDMTKRFHQHTPDILKPQTKYSSRQELFFDLLESSYLVGTAGGDGIGRGETLQVAHLSEMAWWPAGNAKENLNGLLAAIPDLPGTAVFIESTANGVTGPFYEMTQGALTGENGYEVCFLPWYWDPSYRERVTGTFQRTPAEDELVVQHGLDNEQLQFRRRKIAQNGLDLFQQEYPAILEEAFLTSGRPVFDNAALNRSLQSAPDPLRRMALMGGSHETMEWEDAARGELTIYREHDPGATYYIGADVALGVKGGDYSVAQVLDHQKRQVAIWRGHTHPDHFASVLYHLGHFYNVAKLAVESNNHGLLTNYRLGKEFYYPHLYQSVVEHTVTDRETQTLGFATTKKSRPMVIDELRAEVRDGTLGLNDKTTLREMMSFVVKESGKLEGDEGCHDDTVMALAIANHIHDGVWTPVAVLDNYYAPAI